MDDDHLSLWMKIGGGIAAVVVGFWLVFARLLGAKKAPQQQPPLPGPSEPQTPVTEAERLRCYGAFINGMRNRRMSYAALKVIPRDRVIGEEEIAKEVEALIPGAYARKGLSKALKDLRNARFILPSQRWEWHFSRSPIGQVIFDDTESWSRNRRLHSTHEQQLRCFDAIVDYVAESNTFRHVLMVLDFATQPLSADEIHKRAMKRSSEISTLDGVKKLLEKLTDDPFVEQHDTSTYSIHTNGQVLLQCIANRK